MNRKPAHRVILRALDTEGDALPTEFVIFTPGVNESFNGPCLYDAAAEASVMAEYKRHGVRMMIDLEHHSLSGSDRSDSGDARGWFDLEARDGALYAVNVEWTPDGARRLRERTQRYTSPAFLMGDDENETRVRVLLNVAICAMPATYGARPLVRHRLHARRGPVIVRGMLTPDMVQAAMTAIQEQNGEAALALLNDLVVAAASGESPDAPDAPAEDAPPDAAASAVDEAADPPADDPKDPEQNSAVAELTARVAAVEAERAKEIDAERRTLVARLVALRAETPATAWEANSKGTKPVKRLADESIVELRARVNALASGVKPEIKPPAGDPDAEIAKLSRREIDACKKRGIELKDYIARKKTAVRRVVKGAQ